MRISLGTRASRFSNYRSIVFLPVPALLFFCGGGASPSHVQSSYYLNMLQRKFFWLR